MTDIGSKKASESIKSHRDLIAWQKAMDLTVTVYELTKTFPREELVWLDVSDPTIGLVDCGQYR